jgi:hypothetical protein
MTNNQPDYQSNYQSENRLSDNLRLEYLSEMQVTSWALRAPFKSADIYHDDFEAIVSINALDEHSKREIRNSKPLEALSNMSVDVKVPEDNESVTVNAHASTVDNTTQTSSQFESNQFLNLVNWDSAIVSENTREQNGLHDSGELINQEILNKNLLIVCRHQIDQPANSFANKQSPSHFMQDYLKMLIDFGLQNNLRINIQLAHLTQAGLGESSMKIESYFEKKQPDFTLVLGDETVTNLIDKESDVKGIRCRLNKMFFGANAIASYHPFDLISNPRLKSLAYEDVKFLINTLCQNNQ